MGFQWFFRFKLYSVWRKEIENLNDFSFKNLTRIENCEFSNYNFANCDSIFIKLCMSIEMIYTYIFAFLNFSFWEKKGSQIFFGAIWRAKKIKIVQWILIKHQKRYNFAQDTANHTFFWLILYRRKEKRYLRVKRSYLWVKRSYLWVKRSCLWVKRCYLWVKRKNISE